MMHSTASRITEAPYENRKYGTDLMENNSSTLAHRREAKAINVIVALPAYNEEQNIAGLLDAIDDALQQDQRSYSIIVVDDGSRDGTAAILESYREKVPLIVHRHGVNQGLGATIRDGLYEASKLASDDDVVITMDADGTHPPGLIFHMVQMIREGHDVVIASRYRAGARIFGLSVFRRSLSYAASILFRVVFPTPGVRDYTCGYRAYRGRVLRQAFDTYGQKFVDAAGFQCMIDILLKLRGLKVIFGEAPMILRYDLKLGESKMKIAKTIGLSLKLLMRRRFGR